MKPRPAAGARKIALMQSVRIANETLDCAVLGTALHRGPGGRASLRDQLDPSRPTLLLLLRHLGCVLCRRMVKDVRIAADRADAGGADRGYPRVVFIHQATPAQGARFFGRYWPGATALSDPAGELYRALGVAQGSLRQRFGPGACLCALRAVAKGHMPGRVLGNTRKMPGALLVSPDGRVLHRHLFRHIGDHPLFEGYPDLDGAGADSPTRQALPQPA